MPTVKAITFIVDSLLSRPKLDYDVGYDAAVKGASVVVLVTLFELICLFKVYSIMCGNIF